MSEEIAELLSLLDQAYDRKAWHGPNLRGSIRRPAADAARRPAPGRRSIAEQVLHAAYWKYTVRRRIEGGGRGGFPLKGSNWFPVDPASYGPAEWKSHVALLDAEHRALRAAVAALPPALLDTIPPGSRTTYRALIQGIALHDVYHAGQIGWIKRLIGSGGDGEFDS